MLLLLWAGAFAVAYWAADATQWRYSGENRYLKMIFHEGHAFRPTLLLSWGAIVVCFIVVRLNAAITAIGAHRATRVKGASLNGAKVVLDPSGVSISGADFGSRYGWSRVEAVHRGRAALVLVIGPAGVPLPLNSLDCAPNEAIQQITRWRREAEKRTLRAD